MPGGVLLIAIGLLTIAWGHWLLAHLGGSRAAAAHSWVLTRPIRGVRLLLDEMWTPMIALELRKREFDMIAISEPAHVGR